MVIDERDPEVNEGPGLAQLAWEKLEHGLSVTREEAEALGVDLEAVATGGDHDEADWGELQTAARQIFNVGEAQAWLMAYTQSVLDLEEFEAAHRAVMAEWVVRQQRVAGNLEELKARARLTRGLSNELFEVTVQTKSHKWLDVNAIVEGYPFVKEIPGVVVVTTTIDAKKIELLAKGDMIPKEVVEKARRSEPLTSAVTIKRKEAKG